MTVQTDLTAPLTAGHLQVRCLPTTGGELRSLFDALLSYGVSGVYDTLTDAVQALGRRAEAAETAAPEEATLSEQLLPIVRALNECMTADIETIVLTALAVQRELSRSVKLYVEDR
jgi:hypothetical protein